jgi:glycine/D-amino acid oxidase-like deaminating enzyme
MTLSLQPPLDLSPARELGQRVGLRPYRPQGFVLRADRLPGGKPVIHNYGHGGSGYTLCWGCAEQAAELAAASGAARFAVLGAGVIGLTTALTLLRRGFGATLYAEALHPEITSSVAGAVWGPTMLFDPAVADRDFLARFVPAAQRTHAVLLEQIGEPRLGVQWVQKLSIGPERPAMIDLIGERVYAGWRAEPDLAARLGAQSAISFDAPIVDPDLYLAALLEDVLDEGGRLVRRRFTSVAEVESLDEPGVVNCTGLGARDLFGDAALEPIRGQVVLLPPQPRVTYSYAVEEGFFYMYPRATSIVLGGTRELGNWSRAADPATYARIRKGHDDIATRLGF